MLNVEDHVICVHPNALSLMLVLFPLPKMPLLGTLVCRQGSNIFILSILDKNSR